MTTPESATAQSAPKPAPDATSPVAKRIPHPRTHHGDTVTDDYAWLANKNDPQTLAHLEAENAFTLARTASQAPLREEIFNEIKRRTKETDLTVPTRKDGYWYYRRTVEGQQYSIHCRVPIAEGEVDPPASDGPLAGEQILLDGNVEAAGSAFFALGTFDVSPDTNLLAYSVDLAGDERFTMRVKDLRAGTLLPDVIAGVFYGSAWSADSSTLFYLTVDDAWRPHRLWRHRIGTPSADDVLVLEESDERFWLGVGLSRSGAYIIIDISSKVTSEARVIPASSPQTEPVIVAARRQGVEYDVEHDPDGQRWLILHNDGAEDFTLAYSPEADPGRWSELIAHTPGTRLLGVDAFAGYVAISLRRDGLTGLRLLRGGAPSDAIDVPFAEAIHTVGLDANLEYQTRSIRLQFSSFITPDSVYDYRLDTGELVLRKRKPVLGGYDPSGYVQHREWATAPDGTAVPISIVARKGTPRDGSAPAVLYGYGSYEASTDPWFSIPRLSLLDRGFVFAVAHVRGGGEMGRRWYEDGKLLAKRNTFTDFVACAEQMTKLGWTSADRLVARGGSAGGLLVGAAINLAPEAFAGAVAQVPFVDPLNTVLDPSLPLTVLEWEEWGNPLESAEAYAYMKSYSPYENVAPVRYPAVLAMTSLNDTRVLYHEPAKWIAKLRAVAPGGEYLLKIEMGAGHGGPSGRYDAWHEEAFLTAWIISLVSGSATAEAADR